MRRRSFSPSLHALAIIGIILFVTIHFIAPNLSGGGHQDNLAEAVPGLTIEQVAEHALAWAENRPDARGLRPAVMHDTHKLWAGYIQKHDYWPRYDAQYDRVYPTEFYKVELLDASKRGRYVLEMHMDTGEVFGWRTTYRLKAGEDPAGRAADEEAAREELRRQGIDASRYTLLPSPPGDKAFNVIFQHNEDKLGQAPRQIAVAVVDGRVAAYQVRFDIPAEHRTWQERQDAQAEGMSFWSLLLSFVMGIVAIGYAVRQRRTVTFTRGLLLTVVYFLLYSVMIFNMLPATRLMAGDFADPAQLSGFLIFSLGLTFGLSVQLYFAMVSGEAMTRSEGWSLWPAWREPIFGTHVYEAMKKGYLISLFALGLQSLLFFLAENAFGTWAISDPSMSVHNMLWPWYFPALAWVAAISEEAVFRLFGVLLFKKMLRVNFLAVLFPSMIWALSHTTYPVYPAYTRFVEVTVLGIVFGYAFLKYGFWTAVFAHAAMNSILMGLSLAGSKQDAASVAVGLLSVASPLLVAWIIRRLHQRRRPRPAPAGGG